MLPLAYLREHADAVRTMLAHRGTDAPLDRILALDERRRAIIAENEALKQRRNEVSRQIGRDKERLAALRDEMRRVGDRIKALDDEQRAIEAELDDLLLRVPNVPHSSVPIGATAEDNVVVRVWGERPTFPFPPRPHWEIGEALGILDLPRAAKISGSRFVLLRGAGAALERALITFMLDVHIREHGYTEVWPPYLVEPKAMVGTGQLPKFAGDFYQTQDGLSLIPTAEVPVTNLHREEILEPGTLPIRYVAFTPCFRTEAGSAGRDTRGMIRVHQFDKVELVKFVVPETSYDELESLTRDAEAILQRLGLHYRTVVLCTGDLGFASAKTYDLEVWMPGQDRYVEISSCSNFEAFQARRARIQFRRDAGARAEYVHTLNGSGLAVGRTLAAVLETYQQPDGSVLVPEALRPYLGVDRIG
ncbi:MAG: serine--tRNA ligase [Chloroflexota bacterium]|nr:serine--tRNA ligase [Dehalococcoidia bacterium]MDW8254684.1 serine--tRNA ligase [Chloroflexota bacterium]